MVLLNNWATRRFSASPETWPRLGAIESISSMNTIDGADLAASSNNSRNFFSDSP